MKNRLLFSIIFAFIFSSCSNFSGNEDEVEPSLKPIKVTEEEEEEEEEEVVVTPKPRTWYDLYGVTFGDNTFVAVGEKGTVRTSSDNGTSWDNGTKGTTRNLKEIAYGDQSFVTVGDYGTILYSSDNGATWDNATWSGSDHLTGVAYGNNIFNAVSSSNVIKSTDNGSNWTLKSSAVEVFDMGFGNRTVSSTAFVGVGEDGSVCYSEDASPQNHGEAWLCPAPIVSDKKLYSIAYGNNKFIAVGESGTVIISDNGSVWDTRNSNNSSAHLYSIAFGNNTFVGVGYKTVIVSTDNGTTFLQTATSYDFNDISFGNGIFVAVGDDENIHTSTDGDDWTKVHGK